MNDQVPPPPRRKQRIPGIPRRPRQCPETWQDKVIKTCIWAAYVVFFVLIAFAVSIILEEITGWDGAWVVIFIIAFLIGSWRMERTVNHLMDFFYY